MLKEKRNFPHILCDYSNKIEKWRASLLRKLHHRIDVAKYLLTKKVHSLFVIHFFYNGLKPSPESEHYVRNELFGLQFALSALNEPVTKGTFLPNLIDSTLTSKNNQDAEKVLDLMSHYSNIRDAFLTYSWGGYEFENPQENVIRFIDSPDWTGQRDHAQRILGQVAKIEKAKELASNTVIAPAKYKLENFIEIPTSLPLGGLNAKQFLEAWLTSVQCFVKRYLNGQSHVIEKTTIIKIIKNHTNLKLHEIERFVKLITFDTNAPACLSLFHCPLVPITTSSLSIILSGFVFGNPNTCIQRLAVYRGKGFDNFANENSKYFLSRIKTHYKTNNVTININKHYTANKNGGDIDLIVFEKHTNRLLIAEVKSFIHPDSTEEVIQANEKLKKGIEQIKKIKEWLDGLDKKEWPSRLGLPNFSSSPSLEFTVIGNGFAGSDYLCIPDFINIVDSEYLLVPRFKQKSIFDAVHEYQQRISEEIRNSDTYKKFTSTELAGITFELPAWVPIK